MGGTIGVATNPPKLSTYEASTSVRPISRAPLVCNSLPSSPCHPHKNVRPSAPSLKDDHNEETLRCIAVGCALLNYVSIRRGHAARGITLRTAALSAPPAPFVLTSPSPCVSRSRHQEGRRQVNTDQQSTDRPHGELERTAPSLSPGHYVLEWRVFTDESTALSGRVRFTVSTDGVAALASPRQQSWMRARGALTGARKAFAADPNASLVAAHHAGLAIGGCNTAQALRGAGRRRCESPTGHYRLLAQSEIPNGKRPVVAARDDRISLVRYQCRESRRTPATRLPAANPATTYRESCALLPAGC